MKKRYIEAVKKYGANACRMIDDVIVREKETKLIIDFFDTCLKPGCDRLADIGCGDGYTLELLSHRFDISVYGFDITTELLDIAKKRMIRNSAFFERDATSLGIEDDFFDFVITQRCLQNLESWKEQKQAIWEIHRVLKPNGLYLLIESFNDGLLNNNKARRECGLPGLEESWFNCYFDKEQFFNETGDLFIETEYSSPTFLSSHYFISRVLHPCIVDTDLKNSEFVKFFSFLPPIGNYSPIQCYVLQKKELM